MKKGFKKLLALSLALCCCFAVAGCDLEEKPPVDDDTGSGTVQTPNTPDNSDDKTDKPDNSDDKPDKPDNSDDKTDKPDNSDDKTDKPDNSDDKTDTPDNSDDKTDKPDNSDDKPDTPDKPEKPSGYYGAITATSGDALLGQIHDLITTTHTHYSTYGDIRSAEIVGKTDKGSADGYIMDFYTQEDISIVWNSNSPAGAWNREHLWCQSLSNGLWTKVNNSSIGGGADLHHLRPSEVKLNATRGNMKYGEVTGSGSSYGTAYYKDSSNKDKYVGGYYSGNTFEPLDKVKGDVARIVLYVYVHYNPYTEVHGTTNGTLDESNFRTLNFTHVMAPTLESEAIALLLKWNELDPVDEIETARNEAVFAIQGNRNPFIDHPEYAKAIWG